MLVTPAGDRIARGRCAAVFRRRASPARSVVRDAQPRPCSGAPARAADAPGRHSIVEGVFRAGGKPAAGAVGGVLAGRALRPRDPGRGGFRPCGALRVGESDESGFARLAVGVGERGSAPRR